jgi:hypothetical protein
VEFRQLRRRCEALIADLTIPEPFDLEGFCANLVRTHGRPIHLLPVSLPADAPCGLWVAGEHGDYIAYEAGTSPVHQRHIILHEIGHLLGRHEPQEQLHGSQARALFPSLSPETVRRILRRTSYTTDEEREAELIASLILRRIQPSPSAPAAPLRPADAAVLHRLAEAMERTEGPR